MADKTHIEWTDATWNVVTGCSVVSPGCTNCYAMRLAGGRMQHHPSRAGLTIETKAGPVWNGQVRFNEAWLNQPLSWKTPRKIFVAAHGDLFHEGVTDEQLDAVFDVMARCGQHTFQVLTKRADRLRKYIEDFPVRRAMFDSHAGLDWAPWPLPNVWLGVSVEDQARADERIPLLLDTPAALRWISAEPLLGPINLNHVKFFDRTLADGAHEAGWESALNGKRFDPWNDEEMESEGHPRLDWVVVGGESGSCREARPLHPEWTRLIRDQCADEGVAFLFKQWGSWQPIDKWQGGPTPQRAIMLDASPCPDDAVPQDVGAHRFVHVGKKAAGRLLDGVLHDGYPEACHV